jgi:hypothetical protein
LWGFFVACVVSAVRPESILVAVEVQFHPVCFQDSGTRVGCAGRWHPWNQSDASDVQVLSPSSFLVLGILSVDDAFVKFEA